MMKKSCKCRKEQAKQIDERKQKSDKKSRKITVYIML